MWGITSFFNPAGYQSRIANYRVFRSRLKVPLVAVELSFTGEFELRGGDAEILIQIFGGDVMWQKERLLNLAVGALPRECDLVAWLDCDVVFPSNDWPDRARHALKTSALVQLFSERRNLAAGVIDELPGVSSVQTAVPGSAFKFVNGTLRPEDLCLAGSLLQRRCTNGLGWAASRRLIEAHSFYDARIVGSGDKSIFCAAIGKFEYCEQAGSMNSRQCEHYRSWALPFFAAVAGRIGYLQSHILHLWHGEPRDRQYEQRHSGLRGFDFDPHLDIALDSNSVWRWNSNKPELHEFIRRYFDSRREDGRAPG